VVLNTLRGLAVDYETGRLYVADANNNRVDVFEEDGTFLFAFGWRVNATTPEEKLQTCNEATECQKGTAGSGAGQLNHPGRIAVDNDPASPTPHAVYVAEDSCQPTPCTPNHRVQKFDDTGAFLWSVGSSGEAEGQFTSGIFPGVGPGGVLYVLDNPPLGNNTFKHRLQRFEPNGTLIAPQCFASEGIVKGKATSLAVEAGGDFWVSNENDGKAIRKYNASCGPLLSPPGKEIDPGIQTNFLAIGAAGNLLAMQIIDPYGVITTYDPSGNHLRRFGYDEVKLSFPFETEGLAAGAAGAFLAAGNAGIKLLVEPPPGPIIAPSSVEASPVRSVWAAIGAEINPEGKATEYEVQWVDKASYEAEGFAGPNTRDSGKLPLGASDFSLHAIEEAIAGCKPFSPQALEEGKCLAPETEYRFRLIAENADGEDEVEGEFKTLKPLEIEALYASEVGTDSATLNAEVDPLGSEATGSFQYIDEAGYQAGIEAAEEEGKSRQEAEEEGRGFDEAIEIPDVESGATPILFGAGEGTVRRSATLYLLAPGTTYRYRLVAQDNFATQISETKAFTTLKPQPPEPCPNEAFRTGPSALLPDCRAYELVTPLDKGGADIRVLPTNSGDPAVLEQSSISGDRLAFGSVRAFGDAASAPLTSQYIARRVEGSEWQTHSINSPRRGKGFNAIAEADSEFKFFSPDLCDAWQIPYDAETPLGEGAQEGLSGFVNLYRRSDRLCGPEAYEALAPLAKPKGLPKGVGLVLELMGVSGDGTHAIFRTNGELTKEGTGGFFQLYESVQGAGLRFVCVLPGPGGGVTNKACMAGSGQRNETRGANVQGAISEDGERIYWSDSEGGEGKLYLRVGGTQTLAVSEDAEAAAGTSGSFFWGASKDGGRAIFTTGGRLYEFTLAGEATQLLAEGVLGVMGMSEDASRGYFASSEVLPESGQNSEGAEASEDEPNLYLYEETEGGGQTSFVATLAAEDLAAPLAPEPRLRSSRVSPDGLHAAFTSVAPLTDYDNSDAESGEAVREVYLYDAAAKKLRCASCNPSGARPVSALSKGIPFAGLIPGFETQMHAARVLSEDGRRLYFESADRLAPADSNGAVDVYGWEEAGAGTCTTSSPSYSSQDEGCISLISSGKSPLDSRFVEASPDGRDVFFGTLSSLLPQDYGLIDIYDARAGGGLPTPPPEVPPCEGDSCHNPPAAPVQPTPSSSSYTAPKAPKKKPRKSCPKGKKAKKSAKGKTRCVPKRKSQGGRATR
jgi:hypothetical protein